MVERFHVAEWYGRPFEDLTDAERVAFAGHKVGSATMKKVDVDRLIQLKEAAALGDLKPREQARLEALNALLDRQDQNAPAS